jgi:hypothetical protein
MAKGFHELRADRWQDGLRRPIFDKSEVAAVMETENILELARADSMAEFVEELQTKEAAVARSFLAQEWKRY